MDKLPVEQLWELAATSVTALSAPGKGSLLFVKTEREESLRALAIGLANVLSK